MRIGRSGLRGVLTAPKTAAEAAPTGIHRS
jgi:hypothetical protein